MKELIVEDYNPNWKLWFDEIKTVIISEIQPYILNIVHVGSTSVEGLAAKPIIDMDIIVKDKNDFELCKSKLETLGYKHLGDMGIAGREAFKAQNPKYAHNLYICFEGVDSLRNHLILKKHLCENQADRVKYSQLKKKLAQDFSHDRELYLEGKTKFILSILEKYDFDTDSLKSIEQANKKK